MNGSDKAKRTAFDSTDTRHFLATRSAASSPSSDSVSALGLDILFLKLPKLGTIACAQRDLYTGHHVADPT